MSASLKSPVSHTRICNSKQSIIWMKGGEKVVQLGCLCFVFSPGHYRDSSISAHRRPQNLLFHFSQIIPSTELISEKQEKLKICPISYARRKTLKNYPILYATRRKLKKSANPVCDSKKNLKICPILYATRRKLKNMSNTGCGSKKNLKICPKV